jgi:hypothetical protein
LGAIEQEDAIAGYLNSRTIINKKESYARIGRNFKARKSETLH